MFIKILQDFIKNIKKKMFRQVFRLGSFPHSFAPLKSLIGMKITRNINMMQVSLSVKFKVNTICLPFQKVGKSMKNTLFLLHFPLTHSFWLGVITGAHILQYFLVS